MSGSFEAAASRLFEWAGERRPAFGLALGSGLGSIANALLEPQSLPFASLPGLPGAAVEGHAGEFVLGRLAGHEVLVQRGRFHGYEGHEAATVALPVRLMARLGVRTLFVTNAAGGIHPCLEPGSLMLVAEQLNLTFRNPLFGPVPREETRFPDMSQAYDPGLRRVALEVARTMGLRLEEGTYAGLSGPSYETPAEIRMLQRLGADAVGMSTVLEVVAARALGVRCLGISIITNRAAGLGSGRLTHDDVLARAGVAGASLARFLEAMLRSIN